jgi:nucleotide-binding universal stress UspA family protein
MSQQVPNHILCGVRSRPGGEETVARAIDLALESGAQLTFCQIVDTTFINRFSGRGSARKAATEEIHDMAEFALSIICDQALAAGVSNVNCIVRVGDVRGALLELVAITGADLLVLGRPQQSVPGRSVFDDRKRSEFIAEMEAAGVAVND